jgi:ABC-type glycerol-3-phosphate transport system substrate-binding protein
LKTLLLLALTLFIALPAHTEAVYIDAGVVKWKGDMTASIVTNWERRHPDLKIVCVSLNSSGNGWIEGVLITYRARKVKSGTAAATKVEGDKK